MKPIEASICHDLSIEQTQNLEIIMNYGSVLRIHFGFEFLVLE